MFSKTHKNALKSAHAAKITQSIKEFRKAIDKYKRDGKGEGDPFYLACSSLSSCLFQWANAHSIRESERIFREHLNESKEMALFLIKGRPSWSRGPFRMGEVLLLEAKILADDGSNPVLDWKPTLDEAKKYFEEAKRLEVGSQSLEVIEFKLLSIQQLEEEWTGPLLFKQLRPGVNGFCRSHKHSECDSLFKWKKKTSFGRLLDWVAKGLQNCIYIIGDRRTKKVILVDPCWDIDSLVIDLQRSNWTISACLLTHGHVDHAGGRQWGVKIPGVKKIIDRYPNVPVIIHQEEVQSLLRQTGIPEERVLPSNDLMDISDLISPEGPEGLEPIWITLIHTPGHTRGSQCILVESPTLQRQRLLTGDTLFVGCCGRTDMEGGDSEEMWTSLQERIGDNPLIQEDSVIYPGHSYGGRELTTLRKEKIHGILSKAITKEFFMRRITGG